MEAAGYTQFEIIAMMDERTTKICRSLNGKIFEIKNAIETLDSFFEANTYDELVSAKPWVKEKKDGTFFIERSGRAVNFGQTPKPEDLSKYGIAGPPFHGHCRTTIGVYLGI
jgi:hypothetical protein